MGRIHAFTNPSCLLAACLLASFAQADPPSCDETLEWGSQTTTAATELPGDLNNDGLVDLDDVASMMRALVDPLLAQEPDAVRRADLNKDGKVDAADLTLLLHAVERGLPLPICEGVYGCCYVYTIWGGCCGLDICNDSPDDGDDGLDPGGDGGGPGSIGGGGGGGGGGGTIPPIEPPLPPPPPCEPFYITPDFPYEKNNPPAEAPNIPPIGIDHLILSAKKDVTIPASGQIEWYLFIDGHDDEAPDFFGHTITFKPDCLQSNYQIRALSRKADGTICFQVGPIDIKIHRAMPKSVTFGGDNHTIHHDATGDAYDAPHWLDFDRDGQITAPPQSPPGASDIDRRFPIAYTRNTPMKITELETYFSKDAFGGIPQPQDYTIVGTGSDGSIYTSAPTIPYAPFTGSPLPDHITYLPN